MSKSHSLFPSYIRLFTLCILLISSSVSIYGQTVNLTCQTEFEAVEDLERKNWNGGSTAAHSEGSMHNFTLPTNTFGDCKRISNISIVIDALGVDLTNLPADCNPTPTPFYYNIHTGCAPFIPASCPGANLIGEPNTFAFTNQNLSFNGNFDFGGNLAVDIVPVMNIGCTNGQSALSSDGVILDYEICVTVTIVDDLIDNAVDLGDNQTICPTATFPLDAGSYTEYAWSPTAETTQMIDAAPSTYTVTVTDINGCTDTDQVVILAFADAPITFNPSAPTVCDGGQTSVSVNEVYTSYEWSNTLTGQTVNLSAGSYDVTITDNNNCTAVNSVTVTSIPAPNAGDDNSETVCEGIDIDLNTLLSASADAAGTFSDPAGTGTLTGSTVSTAGQGGMTFNYTYTVGLISDPCGQDEATFTITIESPSEAGDDNSETICEGVSFDLNDLLDTNAETGGTFSDPSGSGILVGSTVTPTNQGGTSINFLYTVGLPADACGTDQATLTINIESETTAGGDNSDTVCDGEFVDLLLLLDPTATAGGVFSDPATTGSLSGNTVNTLNLGGQTYDFIYTVGLPSDPCGEDQATITITVEPFLNAGDDNTRTVCEGESVNLNDLLDINADFGGTFSDPTLSGSLSGSTVTTTGLVGQTIDFLYTVGIAGGSCGTDEATLTVTVVSSVNAGDDNTITVCEGNDVDLNTLLSINADLGGSFSDPGASGSLSGSTVTTNGLAGETIIIIYTVGLASDPCGEDQATFTLNIENSLEAGDNNEIELCLGGIIDLKNYLVNADAGGMFFDANGSGGLNGDFLNTDLILPGTYIYEYSFLGNNCPFDFANIEISFTPGMDSAFEMDTTELCFNVCEEINISFMGDGPFTYDISVENTNGINQASTTLSTTTNTSSITLCNSFSSINFTTDTLNFSNSDSLLITLETLDGGTCAFTDSLWVTSLPANIFQIDTSICIFDTLFVGDLEFFLGNSTYVDTIDGITCDSFININVTFDDVDTSYILESLCPGDSTNYFSTWFTESNPYEEITIDTESGCDSLVIVDISFFEVADSLIDLTLCEGDFITVNTVTYNEANPNGQVILENASSNGCDSLITINLQFGGGIDIMRTDTLCEGGSIVIGGTVIDASNNPIELTVPGVDCDTIFDVNLTFLAPTENFITGVYCSDFDTLINGTLYNIDNSTDIEMITGGNSFGCDSIITINLDFYTEAQNLIDTTICSNESFVINGTTYNEDNITGSEILTTQNGCDSTITINVSILDIIETNQDFMPCEGDSIFLMGAWQFVDGTYVDIFTSSLGCDSIINSQVTFMPCNVDVIVNTTGNNCVGESLGVIDIEVQSEIALPYFIVIEEISTGTESTITVSTEQNFYQFPGLNSGMYSVSILGSDNAVLYNNTASVIDLFPELNGSWNLIDTIFCADGLAQLEFIPIGGLADYTYVWNITELGNEPIIDQVPSGTYSIMVSDTNGCSFESSFTIDQPGPITFDFEIMDISCIGIDNGMITIENIQGGTMPYTILINNMVTDELIADSLAEGLYTIEVIDSESCNSMVEQVSIVETTANILANYTLVYDITEGDSVQLIGDIFEDNLTFEWTPSTSLNCTDCAEPISSPITSTSYDLVITNSEGCEQIIDILVNVISDENILVTPNIFSPNRDGINDEFLINLDNELVLQIELTVFDRWGNQMHNITSTDGSAMWDGTMNGNELLPGVYVYQLTINYVDGSTEMLVNDITLIK